ncbi:MAG: hypothetical protein JNK29_16600, partial [Anaerolineales bacterium]|nr:hypothetical protein [Anaerolineales bacterium]
MNTSDTAARRAASWPAALSLESAAYLALFGLALALRLAGLGAHPLNDPEAREALTVLRLLNGGAAGSLPHSPLYFFFTYLAFLMLPPSDLVARLAPALAGAGLVLLPWFFRRDLGRAAALITSGLLAVSAGLLAASRSAEGTTLTLFALGLALGWLRETAALHSPEAPETGNGAGWRLIGAAAALGLAAAGGGPFLTALLLLGLLAVVAARTQLGQDVDWRAGLAALGAQRLALAVAFGLGLLVPATVALIYRAGLGALANSWLIWLTGFAVTAPGRSLLVIPVFLIAYEPLLLVFG